MNNTQLKMQIENAIPDGYKRTEVGVIPKDWEAKNSVNCLNHRFIAELCEKKTSFLLSECRMSAKMHN